MSATKKSAKQVKQDPRKPVLSKAAIIRAKNDMLAGEFRVRLERNRLPLPTREYQFAAPRKWAFDFAWPWAKLALEVEGGVWTHGRHTRGSGFLADMEKYNAATLGGWRVLRVTPDQLLADETLHMIARAVDYPAPRVNEKGVG